MSPDPDHELSDLVARLESQRPVPAPTFRGDLKRRLLEAGPRSRRRLPRRRLFAATYAGSGFALLAVAALGVTGLGPRAPG